MKNVIFVFSIALISGIYSNRINAQVYISSREGGSQHTTGLLDLMENTNVKWRLNDKSSNIDGSPYLNDEFEIGEVVLTDNSIFKEVLLRYNIYNDQMEFQDKGETYAIGTGSDHLLRRITIGDDIFITSIYSIGTREKLGFFSVLADGKVTLLRKHEMKLTDPVPAKPMQDPQPAKFVKKQDVYFLRIGEERIYEINNVKKMVAHLGDHQDELKTYTKKEKISSGDPDELAQLVNYYNSL